MNYIIVFCLAIMVTFATITICEIFRRKGTNRIKYLRNFKKGSFLRIYAVSIPLYWLGIYNSGNYSVGVSFLHSIKAAIDSIMLDFEYDSISKFINDNKLYEVAMWFYFALAIINAVFFAFTLFWQRINNVIKRLRASKKSKINIIIGLNEETKMLLESLSGENIIAILFTKEQEDIDYLTIKKVPYIICNMDFIVEKIDGSIKNIKQKEINIIVDMSSDNDNLLLTKHLCKYICNKELYLTKKEIKRGFNIYVIDNLINESAFNSLVQESKGCIHTINKHTLIGLQFVDKYPMTEFMDNKHIDYESATIRSEVEMNVLMIGFGKVNQQLFLSMVTNNQFLSLEKGEVINKPVNYYIFDKKESKNDKNLNHNYFRYENEILNPILQSDNKDELENKYFPLPPMPANFTYFKIDINDAEFYSSIKACLRAKKDGYTYNYLNVSFGEDLENIDLAKKLQIKLKEWGLLSCTKIFVRIKDKKLIISNVINSQEFCIYGSDADVFNKNVIINSSLEILARLRDQSYIEAKLGINKKEDIMEQALNIWYQYHPIKRKSNIYAGISIRSKLHLLGLDFKEKKVEGALTEDIFMDKYAVDDMPFYGEEVINGKKSVIYPLEFPSSKRRNFAIMEHMRWNAFMICEGFVPAKKTQCCDANYEYGQSYEIRLHRNITTFDGLYLYRSYMAERAIQQNEYKEKTVAEKAKDVIKFDYQIMDDLYWFFDKINYSIVYKDHSAALSLTGFSIEKGNKA